MIAWLLDSSKFDLRVHMNWIISANPKMYDHASSFAHFGSLDWRQGIAKFEIDDVVYIYCTRPIQRIRYKCKVTALNKSAVEIRDDRQYWIDKTEYERSIKGRFFNLRLIEEVDSDKLSLPNLVNNGLNAAPQGPVKLSERLEKYLESIFRTENDKFFPEIIDSADEIYEGIKKQALVNRYERSSVARAKCIEASGLSCKVCDFNFEERYGQLGKGFIHIHHLVPIHSIKDSYKIDYINDLVPICPNCHAMIHRTDPPMSPESLKNLFNKKFD